MNGKLIDLHLHIDGSLSIRWMYERALLRGIIAADTSFEDYWSTLFPQKEQSKTLFNKYNVPLAVMQRSEDIRDACYELVKEICQDGRTSSKATWHFQKHQRTLR